jgi:hypothetical protein
MPRSQLLPSNAVPRPSTHVPYSQVWRHACELFDNYLLACFVIFSGISLEALVWQVCALQPNHERGWPDPFASACG